MPDKKQILNSIAAVAKKLGRAPSRAEFTSRSGISAFFVLQWFRSWSDAVRAAGLRPYTRNAKVEDRALLEDWGNTVRKNRGVLPRHMYRRKAKYNPGRWQRVRIEFEFESKSFYQHGHPLNGCDVIVCWRHNWDKC